MGRLTRLAAATTLGMLALAGPAYAAGGAEKAGQNLGDLLSTVGGYVMFGIAGFVALGMVVARKATAIGGLFLMVFLIGGLFFAGSEMQDLIKGTWEQLGKGV